MSHKPIGQLLKELGYISEKHIKIALEVQKIRKGLLGEILAELGLVSQKEIAEAIAYQAKKLYIDLTQYPPSKEALSTLPKELAKQLEVIPFDTTENSVKIALSNPFDINAIDIIKRRYYGKSVDIYVSEKDTILRYIEIYYFLLENPIDKEIDKLIIHSLQDNASSEIPRLFDLILNNAILNRATDIHISPESLTSHVFYRIDGIMTHYYALPKEIHGSLVSRVKILSNLDIAEQRMPQDGAFSHEFFGEQYDFRVSTVPTAYGENVVIRVLSKNISLFNLKGLGFEEDMYETIERQFLKPQGIILVTGPTGSGKTTTLYAALRRINALEKNILTVEDPIEYKFPFIKQTQVNEKAGYTFARAIRAFLRQDPDVILVGEIRDEETAEMAIRASITGHLVLSTLHTNDAVSAIPRLIDMGIKDYMVASGVSAITAQRLIRRNCNFCTENYNIRAKELTKYGFSENLLKKYIQDLDKDINLKRGKGCSHCNNTGYLGRTLIVEVLEINAEIADLIVQGATPLTIQKKAIENGMRLIKEDGLIKVLKGITTPEEIKRVAGL